MNISNYYRFVNGSFEMTPAIKVSGSPPSHVYGFNMLADVARATPTSRSHHGPFHSQTSRSHHGPFHSQTSQTNDW